MALSVGIVGLPNAGKSTLFNALCTKRIALTANYAFTTVEPNVGVVAVPDENLEVLAQMFGSKKKLAASVRFVDIAGLIKGAHRGQGLGNKFLSHIRECDLVVHVLRMFEDVNTQRAGSVDPLTDFEVVRTELILKDLESLNKQLLKKIGIGDEEGVLRRKIVLRLIEALDKGKRVLELDFDERERDIVRSLFLLSLKPEVIVINISETQIGKVDDLLDKFGQESVLAVCARLESELDQLSREERREYLDSLGENGSALDKLIRLVYKKLGLITFYTANRTQARAWSIKRGSNVVDAARLVHEDFARNLIRSEVIEFDKLKQAGDWQRAKDSGLLRIEGRNYLVQDKDVLLFKI